MEKQTPLQQAMEQSQKQFRNQFDPNSQSYHKGDQTVVPIGGNRVPQSMPLMYPEGYDPNKAPQVIDYGEEYRKVQADRATYQNLKKALAKLGPVVEAFLRHQQIFKQKGDPNNQKHIKTHEENIAKQKANLAKVQDQLKEYIPKLQQIDGEGIEMANELRAILDQSNKKYQTKQSLGEFNFRVKKISTKTFSEAQKCLQKLKDIKKNYKKPEEKVQSQQQTQNELKQ